MEFPGTKQPLYHLSFCLWRPILPKFISLQWSAISDRQFQFGLLPKKDVKIWTSLDRFIKNSKMVLFCWNLNWCQSGLWHFMVFGHQVFSILLYMHTYVYDLFDWFQDFRSFNVNLSVFFCRPKVQGVQVQVSSWLRTPSPSLLWTARRSSQVLHEPHVQGGITHSADKVT